MAGPVAMGDAGGVPGVCQLTRPQPQQRVTSLGKGKLKGDGVTASIDRHTSQVTSGATSWPMPHEVHVGCLLSRELLLWLRLALLWHQELPVTR